MQFTSDSILNMFAVQIIFDGVLSVIQNIPLAPLNLVFWSFYATGFCILISKFFFIVPPLVEKKNGIP